MWTMLAGVPGKLKTLIDRLTATRAANLDKLDANITTRAVAATALSNAVWTDARAGKLDLVGETISPTDLPPIAGGIDFDASSINDSVHTTITTAPSHLSFVRTDKTTAGTVTVVDITGKGVLNYFAFGAQLLASGSTITLTGNVTLIIDGVTFSKAISMSTASATYIGRVVVGGDVLELDQIPFNQSLVITITKDNNGTIRTVHKYRQVA